MSRKVSVEQWEGGRLSHHCHTAQLVPPDSPLTTGIKYRCHVTSISSHTLYLESLMSERLPQGTTAVFALAVIRKSSKQIQEETS